MQLKSLLLNFNFENKLYHEYFSDDDDNGDDMIYSIVKKCTVYLITLINNKQLCLAKVNKRRVFTNVYDENKEKL